MATPQHIRRRALQALYQLDARGEADADAILHAISEETDLSPRDCAKAMDLALGAFRERLRADEEINVLAPDWPSHRQPVIDRSILRLAHYEMVSGRSPPKAVVNECVELAKEFSTERSPAFINGVLDKILKRVLAQASPATETPAE